LAVYVLEDPMVKTIEAVFDGKVLHPEDPLILEPNTRVRITIETVESATDKVSSFLRTARSLNLDGPPDWAVNLDTYLYGGVGQHDG
jgi:predicted DNA-binding antitoxin AbrB/MazE fold protein